MTETVNIQRGRIHPYKFTMWVAIGSIIMMFAGLTSAYIVKRSQAGWVMIDIPLAFWFSTVVILASSVTVHLAVRASRERDMPGYRKWMVATAVLGTVFLILQTKGFMDLRAQDIRLVGAGSNASHSFLLAIAGLHGLHVLGGVAALLVIAWRVVRSRTRTYSSVPAEVISTYWHFVDVLWIYLILFFNWMR
ncbi:MAG: heme-copper oxidase subunit III [Chitinophagia bacterium]|nr:heme-copper oxidase subunit III [Chitinophagia bacterium]